MPNNTNKTKVVGAVGGSGKPSTRRNRVRLGAIILLALAGLFVVFVLGSWAYHRFASDSKEDVTSQQSVCSDQTLSKAAELLEAENIEGLTPLVEEIKRLQNYQSDPNCVGVLATYYIGTSAPGEAREAYNQLVTVFNPEAGYSPNLEGQVLPPEDMRSNIEFIEQQYQQVLNQGGQYGGAFGDERDD